MSVSVCVCVHTRTRVCAKIHVYLCMYAYNVHKLVDMHGLHV